MAKFTVVSKLSELGEGAMKKVTAAGTEVMLANVKGKVYAVADRCAHAGGDLSRGKTRRECRHLPATRIAVGRHRRAQCPMDEGPGRGREGE